MPINHYVRKLSFTSNEYDLVFGIFIDGYITNDAWMLDLPEIILIIHDDKKLKSE